MNIAHIDKAQAQQDAKLGPHMEGETRTQRLFNAADGNGQDILVVYFSSGGRTRPHTHKQGQILHILEGRGIVAIEGERRQVTADDVVVIPPGVWHWHGANPDTAMSHLALQGPASSGDLNWDVDERDWASGYEVTK